MSGKRAREARKAAEARDSEQARAAAGFVDPACAQDWAKIDEAAARGGWRREKTGWRRVGERGSQEWSDDGWAADMRCYHRVRPVKIQPRTAAISAPAFDEARALPASGAMRSKDLQGDTPSRAATGSVAAPGDSESSASDLARPQTGSEAPRTAEALATPKTGPAAALARPIPADPKVREEALEARDRALASMEPDARAAALAALTPTIPAVTLDAPSAASLKALRTGRPTLDIGYDSEWLTLGNGDRRVLSYQFSWYEDVKEGFLLHELVVFTLSHRTNARGMEVFELPSDLVLSVLFRLCGFQEHKIETIRKWGFRRKGLKLPRKREDMPEGWARGRGEDGKEVAYAPTKGDACRKSNYLWHPHKHRFDQKVTVADLPAAEQSADVSAREWRYCFPKYFPESPESVTLVCHFGKVDLTAFLDNGVEILRRCTDANGVFTKGDGFTHVVPAHGTRTNRQLVYNVTLSVRDTMAQAPAGKRALADLGHTIGVPKVTLDGVDLGGGIAGEEAVKSHMDLLLRDDPALFLAYASQDAVVTVTYLASIFGLNEVASPTLPSGAARAMRDHMQREYEADGLSGGRNRAERNASFDAASRGLRRVSKGLAKGRDGRLSPYGDYEAVSVEAGWVLDMCREAYYGGFNACPRPGFYTGRTYDLDIRNAYPTMMALVPDIDWESPIRTEVVRRELALADFASPAGPDYTLPGVFDVTVTFPEGTRFPCVIQKADGVPVYTRTVECVRAMTPEVLLALKMGAKVECDRGFFLNPRVTPDGRIMHSLASAIKSMVQDRTMAQDSAGKGSLDELTLKTMVNSCYGKLAQGLEACRTYDAFHDEMERMGLSSVTNPFAAATITSLVRTTLLATMAELEDMGLRCYSVTTDGFITDAPLEVAEGLDMMGLKPFVSLSRRFLTEMDTPAGHVDGDPACWSLKHLNSHLLNPTTRCNVCLHVKGGPYDARTEGEVASKTRDLEGVCAHGSWRGEAPKGSFDDRVGLMRAIVSRTGRVPSRGLHFTGFHDLCEGRRMIADDRVTWLSFDYDMKRRPVADTLEEVPVDFCAEGVHGSVCNLDTEPFDDVEEFLAWRAAAKDAKRMRERADGTAASRCIRTLAEWSSFIERARLRASTDGEAASSVRVGSRGMDWAVIFSCVRGHRMGMWEIPRLSRGRVRQKLEFINMHNDSPYEFTSEDWKNAGRRDRKAQVLDMDRLAAKLAEMGARMRGGTAQGVVA